MSTCTHVASSNLRPPRADQSVYREDCTLCFDDVDSAAGIDVCLHCFNGGCAGDRAHNRLHAQHARHPLALNIRRTRKRKARDDGEPPEKISRLAIQAETEEDRYDFHTSVHCLECQVDGLEKEAGVAQLVEGVMKANTYARQQEIKAWEQEMIPCEHTLCLEQEPGRTIASGDLSQCSSCELKENLWLCLECGNLGCGRQQMGGLPGNSHAKAHAQATSHAVAVKLGSLTADGSADIYCYGCDDERIDPELVTHLANWGIDIAGRTKTEKSLTEMQLEENLRWDFSMTTEDGKEMKSLSGPGFTGLKNLGNTCYMASVLQSLFSMPEFVDRYHRPNEQLVGSTSPADDFEIQLRKLADGLLSGRYSSPDQSLYQSNNEHDQPHQKGIAPAMLKHLVGKGHAEFSTVRQQDSFELLLHLLKLMTRAQQATQAREPDVKDPVEAFRFVMEQKLQCLSCKRVRYRSDVMENLAVAVPIKRVKRQEAATAADGTIEKEETSFEPVSLRRCIEDFTAPEMVELTCAGCGHQGFLKQTLFKTFPTILTVNARRFEIVNWVPTKQDVPVIVEDDELDLEAYRSPGKQPGEEELPEDSVGPSDGGASRFVPNEGALEMLMGMGFPRVRCEKALHATGNADPEVAAAWLFEHMDDPDIDVPLDLGGQSNGVVSSSVDPDKIDGLTGMGFSVPQARQALKETGGDMERAVDWLFSHPDATGDFGEDEAAQAGKEDQNGEVASAVDDGRPAKFGLRSIVCHKGTSIHAGHYVAFVKKALSEKEGEGWVLFNDEKVAMGADADEMKKFAYIYFFRRTA